MLSQMRQGTFIKTVLWVVVVAFIATMVFVWGADLQGVSCSSQAPQGQRWVGKVGDQPISWRAYEQRLQLVRNQNQQSRRPDQVYTADEIINLRDQVFDQMVRETLFNLEVERLKLQPSDDEIADVLITDPPEFIKRQFTDQQGNFNRAGYMEVLQNDLVDWAPIEDQVRVTLPLERLQQMIDASVHVGEGEIKQEFERRFAKAKVFYAGATWRDIELETEDPGDEALRAYYEENIDEFEEPERYSINAVKLSRDPSPEDEAYIMERVNEIRAQIEAGQDFAELAKIYSEDLSNAEQGGDLGWFGRGRMMPEFEEAAFALAEGEISAPVRTQYGIHLIKKEGHRDEPEAEEVSVRHILLKVEPSYATLDSMVLLADSLYASAKRGEDLAAAAEKQGLEVISPPPFLLGESIQGIGFNSAIRATVERMEPGQVSRRFSGREADYIIQLLDRSEPGPADFDAGRAQILSSWQVSEKKRMARERAEELLRLQTERGMSLRQAAEEMGLEGKETEEFSRKDYIPGIGSEGPFQKLTFMLNNGDVSNVVETSTGAFVLEVLAKIPADKTLYQDEHDKIEESLLNAQRQAYYEGWLESLKERYEVQDYRDELFNDA